MYDGESWPTWTLSLPRQGETVYLESDIRGSLDLGFDQPYCRPIMKRDEFGTEWT